MMTNEINDDLEKELFINIRLMEGENLKTKKYSDREMVNRLMKYIQKIVDKNEEED